MKRALTIEFTKMNGAGNDFIVMDNRFYEFSISELSLLAKQVCPRRTGIGADGILALANSELPGTDYRMIYVNADGSEGTMCGNGARCLARFAYESGFCRSIAYMQTASGICEVHIHENGLARVHLDAPRKHSSSIVLDTPLPDEIIAVHYLWPGTQHLVCFTSNVSQFSVEYWGPLFRNDLALKPEGANINFVEVDSDSKGSYLYVRTFEKGVEAETLACGTGAIASVVAAQKAGFIAADVCNVHMRGGVLNVGSERDRVYLEGPVEIVYRGSMELKPP